MGEAAKSGAWRLRLAYGCHLCLGVMTVLLFVPKALLKLGIFDVIRMVEWYEWLGKVVGVPLVVLVGAALVFTLAGGRRERMLWLLAALLLLLTGIVLFDDWLPAWLTENAAYYLIAAYTLGALVLPMRWFLLAHKGTAA